MSNAYTVISRDFYILFLKWLREEKYTYKLCFAIAIPLKIYFHFEKISNTRINKLTGRKCNISVKKEKSMYSEQMPIMMFTRKKQLKRSSCWTG